MIANTSNTETIVERRQRLRAGIAKMAEAIANEGYAPSQVELDRLIELCQEYFLPVEAARVKRWMGRS